MINLKDMAEKLDAVLNGNDPEIPNGLVSPANGHYFFRVFAQGLYLSQINDMNTGKNFIPVVIGGFSGENNPVKGLGEKDRNATIEIYFPVRFKDEFFDMEDFLDEVFVGNELTFGTQKAVCNLSPAEFGELQDFNFHQFNKWVENTYLMPAEEADVYMVMRITLYISTAKGVGSSGGFVYGNSYTTSISIGTITSGTFSASFSETDPIFIETTDTASASPASQQILGENYAKGLPVTTAYTKQTTLYVKDSSDYIWLLDKYLTRDLQGLVVKVSETFDIGTNATHPTAEKYYYLTGIVVNKAKGQLMTVTLTLGDYLEV